jgi:hypothetical protein
MQSEDKAGIVGHSRVRIYFNILVFLLSSQETNLALKLGRRESENRLRWAGHVAFTGIRKFM